MLGVISTDWGISWPAARYGLIPAGRDWLKAPCSLHGLPFFFISWLAIACKSHQVFAAMRPMIRNLWSTCIICALFLGFHFFDTRTKPISGSSDTHTGADGETDEVVEDVFNKNSRLEWGRKPVPQTKIPVHLSGQSQV